MRNTFKIALLATASFTFSAALAPAPAFAQNAEVSDDAIVVTGTRVPGRSRLDTVAPVDVIGIEQLEQRGTTELATALAVEAPSITFPRPSLTDGTDSVRPATLRGQGPDQTLVLVNGVRRHVSAQVNTNGTVGRGSAPVDLNAIPISALERIEILRDGASAQYGSDAIAGVVNLRLRQASTGGGVSATYGQYLTTVDFPRAGERDINDGQQLTVAGWQGFALGADGFLTISAQFRDRNHSNRSDIDIRPSVDPNRVTARFGDPDSTDWSAYLNAGVPIAAAWEAYGWLGYQQRDALSAAGFRVPTDAQNVITVYPDGYLPLIGVDTQDLSTAGGVRGEIGGFTVDFNLGYGRNELDYSVHNTINPSFGDEGAATQTSFYAGSLLYSQLTFGADASRAFDVGLAGPLNVAFGLEARRESYEIGAGEPRSYDRGPLASPVPQASRGYSGFAPSNEVDVERDNVGVYVDVEGEVFENFTASAAIRFEDYSDFGDSTTGKIAARYDFTPSFALRGAASTGFRAPSLQQQYFTQTSITLLPGGIFTESGTFPSNSAVGRALGGTDLQPEESENYSLGAVFRSGAFELTVDAYRIDVTDRIILSELLQGNAAAAPGTNARVIADLLDSIGSSATSVRFFINGVDTETTGLDVVARYRLATDNVGDFAFTFAGNTNNFKVTRLPFTDTFSSSSILPERAPLFGRRETSRFEDGTPAWKTTFQTEWSNPVFGGELGATLRATTYASVLSAGLTAPTDTYTGVRTVVDLEGRYRFASGFTIAVGADNLLDAYPRESTLAALGAAGTAPFSSFSPFGFNGRFVYTRLSLDW